jgi:hypothetical protein
MHLTRDQDAKFTGASGAVSTSTGIDMVTTALKVQSPDDRVLDHYRHDE